MEMAKKYSEEKRTKKKRASYIQSKREKKNEVLKEERKLEG